MIVHALGEIGVTGVVWPGSAAMAGEILGVIASRGTGAEARGVSIRASDAAVPLWSVDFPDAPLVQQPTADGVNQRSIGKNSIVGDRASSFFLLSGTSRLKLDAATGSVVARTDAPSPPTAEGVLIDRQLLVPENHEVAVYDTTTMSEVDRISVPGKGWVSSPIADGLCAVTSFTDSSEVEFSVWDMSRSVLWAIPGSKSLTSTPTRFGPLAVIASGPGPGDLLTGIRIEDGAVVWEVGEKPQGNWGPMRDFVRVPYPVRAKGPMALWLTLSPSAQARDALTGSLLWSVPLSDEPTAFVSDGELMWVATQDQRIHVIDGKRAIATATLPDCRGWPVELFTIGPGHAIAVSGLGSLYALAL